MNVSRKYIEEVEKWSGEVTEESDYHPPEGTFEKNGSSIADQLLGDADFPGQAMRRLVFYMNRAGKNLKNKSELNKAKDIIGKKVESEQES